MFQFVGEFFRGRSAKKQLLTKSRSATAPAKQVRRSKKKGVKYDNELIAKLEKEHRLLMEVFGRIWSEGYEASDFVVLTLHLRDFKSKFQSHLLKENVKFYAYLEQSVRRDAHSLSIVRDFRKDMNDIANEVISFCKKYGDLEGVKAHQELFATEYQGVAQALLKRVQLEERDLYSLYLPR
ncbi:MAG: methionine salvage enolase-phosphatase E1 [Arenicella sp.]|jgi:methionine salvage enolase-phosphatase E1